MNVEHPSLKSRPAYPSHAGVASMAVACLLAPLSLSYADEVPGKPAETSGKAVQRPPGVVIGTPSQNRDGRSEDKGAELLRKPGEMRAEPVPVPGRSRVETPKKDGAGEGSRILTEGKTRIEPEDERPQFDGQIRVVPRPMPVPPKSKERK